MTITLAPMEGVVDANMREILTHVGGFDLCVTEFIRVSTMLFPARKFHDACPELLNGGTTTAGTPVHIQLMGGDPLLMAENAAFVAELGAPGIDINFGCPAKCVNRRDAGAALLQWPERLHQIVQHVRAAVPKDIPVSAKMRLGFQDKSLAIENAQAIETGGAGKLTVHARTKEEGYRPPAHWEWLARVREAVNIPIVANGEIWSLEDYRRCLEISGCQDVMIGRGVIARPDLALIIQANQNGRQIDQNDWRRILTFLVSYYDLMILRGGDKPNYVGIAGRLKQWIKLLGRSYPEAVDLFNEVRRIREPEEIVQLAKAA